MEEPNEGYNWATKAVSDWVMSDPVVRDAAADVIRVHAGPRAGFWLAELLWRALYGPGLPFVNRSNLARHLRGELGAVSEPNFVHVDFEAIRLRLAQYEAEGGNRAGA
jgi:hypothetical protein